MAMKKASNASGLHSSSSVATARAAAQLSQLDAEIAAKVAQKDELQKTVKISAIRRGKSKLSYPPKKCAYCKGLFIPFQKHQKFCCENHQKLYWKYGTIPFEKLARRLELRFEQEVAPLRARVAELERLVTEARAESSRALCLLDMQRDAEIERRYNGGGAAA